MWDRSRRTRRPTRRMPVLSSKPQARCFFPERNRTEQTSPQALCDLPLLPLRFNVGRDLPIPTVVADGPDPFGDWGTPHSERSERVRERLPAAPNPSSGGQRRRPPRLLLIALVGAVAIAAMLVLTGLRGPSSAVAHPPLPAFLPLGWSMTGKPRQFTTSFPSHLQLTESLPGRGAVDYAVDYKLLSKPTFPASQQALPPPGTYEIQILDVPPSAVPVVLGARASSLDPLRLLRYTYEPRGADQHRPPRRTAYHERGRSASRRSRLLLHLRRPHERADRAGHEEGRRDRVGRSGRTAFARDQRQIGAACDRRSLAVVGCGGGGAHGGATAAGDGARPGARPDANRPVARLGLRQRR